MKIGDLVICNCEAEMWYKGVLGTIISFSSPTGDPEILYPNGKIMQLNPAYLVVVNESR
jgi:hypothetical protein